MPLRSATAVLWWLVRSQLGRLVACSLVTSLWLGSQQLIPYIVGNALQEGIIADRGDRLAAWTGALGAVIVVQTAMGISSHHLVVRCRLDAAFRVNRAVMRQITRLGAEMSRKASTGEVISVTSGDAVKFGWLIELIGLICGGLVSFAVAVIVLAMTSPVLAVAVLVGMPALLVLLLPVFRNLDLAQARQRRRIDTLNTIAADTVIGLRVLRGVGGESFFLSRYRAESQAVWLAGTAVARVRALIEAARVLLPGLLLLALVWLGARLAAAGAISPGEFVAFFGYLMFLTRPLQFAILGVDAFGHARVAAQRMHNFLAIRPSLDRDGRDVRATRWPGPVALADPVTGIRIRPGAFTAVVSDATEFIDDLFDRFGCYAEPAARYGGTSLSEYALEDVRRHIHLLPRGAYLFSGDLREQLDVDGQSGHAAIIQALHVASALEIVGLDPALVDRDPPPAGPYRLHQPVAERGRGFSGGQRQRLTLARSLLTDAETLLLVEPTSAVDAHTEARITGRLVRHREGRTTVISTTSPTVLSNADEVVFCGGAVMYGRHERLLENQEYRRVVLR
jgi:ABC-type multidrug transport system fused ATPase/permease subunit